MYYHTTLLLGLTPCHHGTAFIDTRTNQQENFCIPRTWFGFATIDKFSQQSRQITQSTHHKERQAAEYI